MDKDTVEVAVDACLTFATFAAFALPEVGLPLAGLLAAGQGIWHHYRGEDSGAPTTFDMRAAVSEQIYAENIQSSADRIGSVSHELSAYFGPDEFTIRTLPTDLEREIKAHPNGPVANFHRMLRKVVHEGELDPALDALLHTGRTASTPRDVIGLPILLQGGATYLAVYTVLTSVEHHGGIEFDRAKAAAIRQRLQSWIEHATATADRLDKEIADRLSRVSQVTENQDDSRRVPYELWASLKNVFGADLSPAQTAFAGFAVYFTDDGPDVPGLTRTVVEEGGSSSPSIDDVVYVYSDIPSGEAYQRAENARIKYLGDMLAALRRERRNYDPEATRKILDGWRTALEAIGHRIERDRPEVMQAA